jgi:hypothetical protein
MHARHPYYKFQNDADFELRFGGRLYVVERFQRRTFVFVLRAFRAKTRQNAQKDVLRIHSTVCFLHPHRRTNTATPLLWGENA